MDWEQGGSSVGQWNVAQPYTNNPEPSSNYEQLWGWTGKYQ